MSLTSRPASKQEGCQSNLSASPQCATLTAILQDTRRPIFDRSARFQQNSRTYREFAAFDCSTFPANPRIKMRSGGVPIKPPATSENEAGDAGGLPPRGNRIGWGGDCRARVH